jgi:hypothetical protein
VRTTFILKHVEYKIGSREEWDRLHEHLLMTTSKVPGVELRDVLFPRERDEFILVMECSSEGSYLEWREICPPPPGARDWYEVVLSADERFQ